MQDKFNELPVNTRWLMLMMVVVTVGGNFGIFPLGMMYFDPTLVMKFQIWRLVTNFFFLGKLGFSFLMHMMILHQHCVQLETNQFPRSADFLVMLLVCGGVLMLMGTIMVIFDMGSIPFGGMGLVFSIVYVWAKENPEQEVNFVMNLAKFKAFYLPWAYVCLAILMGQSPVSHLCGIFAGHVYVFFKKIFPVQYNRELIWTPDFLHKIYGQTPAGAQPRSSTTNWSGGHSWGTGNRLG